MNWPAESDSFDLTLDSLSVSFVESLFGELTISYISFSSFTAGIFFLCCNCCFWSSPPSLAEGTYGGGDRIRGGREPAVKKTEKNKILFCCQRTYKKTQDKTFLDGGYTRHLCVYCQLKTCFSLLKYSRFGVPSLPAGEQPDCGDLRGNEGFLIAESLSWSQKDRNKVKVWLNLTQKLCITAMTIIFHIHSLLGSKPTCYSNESYLITQPVNNVQVVLSAVSVGEVIGGSGQLTWYLSLVDVSYATGNHGTSHGNCQVKVK